MVKTFVNFPADQKKKKSNELLHGYIFILLVCVCEMFNGLHNHILAAGQLVDQESHHGGFLSGGVSLKAFGL